MANPADEIHESASNEEPPPADSDTTNHVTQPKAGMGSAGVFAIFAMLIVQIVLVGIVLGTRSEISDLRADLEAGSFGSGIPDLRTELASPGPATPATTTGTDVVTGDLPRFLGSGADAALGRNVGDVSGVDYYSGETARFAADGTARAFMVWAHWCPFCQQELPVMAEWQTTSAADFAALEIVSVTTAMDDTASNPLEPYLDASQFPFPVLVDEDGSLARQLGVNAFPFWVFVAPDGTVVGRAAGYIEPANLNAVFEQLNQMAIDGPSALPAAAG